MKNRKCFFWVLALSDPLQTTQFDSNNWVLFIIYWFQLEFEFLIGFYVIIRTEKSVALSEPTK